MDATAIRDRLVEQAPFAVLVRGDSSGRLASVATPTSFHAKLNGVDPERARPWPGGRPSSPPPGWPGCRRGRTRPGPATGFSRLTPTTSRPPSAGSKARTALPGLVLGHASNLG